MVFQARGPHGVPILKKDNLSCLKNSCPSRSDHEHLLKNSCEEINPPCPMPTENFLNPLRITSFKFVMPISLNKLRRYTTKLIKFDNITLDNKFDNTLPPIFESCPHSLFPCSFSSNFWRTQMTSTNQCTMVLSSTKHG